MPIYDQTFRRYTGSRHLQALWWPVAWFTFRPVLRRWIVWIIIGLFTLYLGAMSVTFVLTAQITRHIGSEGSRDITRAMRRSGMPILGEDISLGTIIYHFTQPVKGLLWLMVLIAGAGAIASDRRHNALPLYFSRPLKPWHYIVGKVAGIAIVPLAAMLLTQGLLGLQYVAWYLPASALFTEIPTFVAGGTYALLTCGFLATAMACFSSMSKSARVSGIAFLCFFVLMEKVIPLLASDVGNAYLLALSPLHSLDVIGQFLLNPERESIRGLVDTGALSVGASTTAISAYLFAFVAVIHNNLKVVEVVK